jgi:hypothetical protein
MVARWAESPLIIHWSFRMALKCSGFIKATVNLRLTQTSAQPLSCASEESELEFQIQPLNPNLHLLDKCCGGHHLHDQKVEPSGQVAQDKSFHLLIRECRSIVIITITSPGQKSPWDQLSFWDPGGLLKPCLFLAS